MSRERTAPRALAETVDPWYQCITTFGNHSHVREQTIPMLGSKPFPRWGANHSHVGEQTIPTLGRKPLSRWGENHSHVGE
jgi:hypothetical protein